VIETWLARTFSILVAVIALGLAYGLGVVFRIYLNVFREEVTLWKSLTLVERAASPAARPAFNSHGVVILTVMVGLEAILFAILDAGQAFTLVTEGWGAIVGIIGTLILPLLGYKSVQNITAGKNQPTTISGGGGV
jgi:hypothetical protein